MNYLKELFKVYVGFLIFLFITRSFLYIFYFERFNEITLSQSLLTFIYGARMDTIALFVILVPLIFLFSFTPSRFFGIISKIAKLYVLLWLMIIVFIENVTFSFFAEYDVRPNYIFIEYLQYPDEIFSMLFKTYKLEFLIAFILMALIGKWFIKSDYIDFKRLIEVGFLKRFLLFIPLAVVLFIGIRSSFGHRPANNSDAMYSTNRVLNEITKNSLYSIVEAYYRNNKLDDTKLLEKYGKIDINRVYDLSSKILGISLGEKNAPFLREEKTHFKLNKPKNLVIFIQESMGAQYVGFSGGVKDLTPNMNQLGKEYISFSNLFSNGTRSIRGLAGLSSGFLPIIGEGVVKRPKSQNDFFTVASLLKPYGYKSSFIYGGEARFDNMKSWYLGNGFDEIIEQKDFKNPTFTSSWGVCDEDLVTLANEKFKSYHKDGKPFVTVMFSQSNHMPFELPENKIEFVKDKPKQSVENAVKYADFAIGKLFELAKKEEYFKDTVFVVAADHNIRTYGDDIVPVNMFHIPAIIISDGQPSQNYNKLTTQPDVLATALDLIGLDLKYPILGKSIYSDEKRDISLMLFNEFYALREGNSVAVLGPNIKPKTYKYENSRLIESEQNKNLEESALALIWVLNDLYKNKLY